MTAGKQRLLFIYIHNLARSQMSEAFSRAVNYDLEDEVVATAPSTCCAPAMKMGRRP